MVTLRTALNVLPDSMPRLDAVSVDGRVLLFAIGTALLTGILCSVAPAFAALRTNLLESLKESARTGTGGASHARLRTGLVEAEIAIALVLLAASGAFLRSYIKMLSIDTGFRPEHLVVAGYQLPLDQYGTDETVNRFDREVLERLRNKPGVMAAGMGNTLPSSGNSGLSGYTLEGERAEGWKLKFAAFGAISGDYFKALGIPMLAGRPFDEQDRADAPPVVIVSQSMAEHSWPGQNPLGKRLHAGNPEENENAVGDRGGRGWQHPHRGTRQGWERPVVHSGRTAGYAVRHGIEGTPGTAGGRVHRAALYTDLGRDDDHGPHGSSGGGPAIGARSG